MVYDLPKSVEIDGDDVPIRYDYRAILDIFEALNDPELSDGARSYVALNIFYPNFGSITDYSEASAKMIWFINGGQDEKPQKSKKLMDWEQDFRYIAGPVNKVLGYDVRGIPYDYETNTGGVHWWTFLSAYMEIGDCLFAQIVRVRSLKAKGKQLDKQDREFYRENRDMVDLKARYSEAENDVVNRWT